MSTTSVSTVFSLKDNNPPLPILHIEWKTAIEISRVTCKHNMKQWKAGNYRPNTYGTLFVLKTKNKAVFQRLL